LAATILAGKANHNLTCIEELENCLHPRAIQKLLKFLQEQSSKRQVIITTHSPYLLNGVEPSSVLVAVVDDTGATHFEKPTNRKALNAILKSKYVDFGDLLVTNFEEVLTPRDSK
jgi:predicted ATPase